MPLARVLPGQLRSSGVPEQTDNQRDQAAFATGLHLLKHVLDVQTLG